MRLDQRQGRPGLLPWSARGDGHAVLALAPTRIHCALTGDRSQSPEPLPTAGCVAVIWMRQPRPAPTEPRPDDATDQPGVVARPRDWNLGSRPRIRGVTAVHHRSSHPADPLGRLFRHLPRHQPPRRRFPCSIRGLNQRRETAPYRRFGDALLHRRRSAGPACRQTSATGRETGGPAAGDRLGRRC